MSSSLESQESCEDVVSDTPPCKNHRNGSDSPTSSPPKRQKKKQKRLCKETVKQDTAQVMRSYLLRCNSLTEEELEEDLEVDADDESADESENQRIVVDQIAKRLQQMGDEFNEKYKKGDTPQTQGLNDLLLSLVTEYAYDTFKSTLRNFCSTLCGDGDPDVDSLALVFYLTQRFIVAAKEAGRKVDEVVHFGQRYVNEVYGGWIEEQGGWGQVLGDGTAV
ncbi:uncharacterized protein [Amphiura filiformis]|uniref:uncharacterized protein n=1 Tax=Amphiura filiformis TaxID=82378 RepID=UPI003B22782E